MKEIKKVAEKFAESIISDIRQNMDKYSQGSSNLAESLRYEANEESIKIFAADYWDFAEKGRPGGKIPNRFEDILSDWVNRHHIKFDGEKHVFCRNVAWSIARYGTRMWRNGETRDFIGDSVEKNIENFENELKESLIEEIKKSTKE